MDCATQGRIARLPVVAARAARAARAAHATHQPIELFARLPILRSSDLQVINHHRHAIGFARKRERAAVR
jgi:hypothetical protein